jgi:hypothetical protein
MDTPNEYLDGIRLILRHHSHNIGWPVRRTNRYTEVIFAWYPPDPTVPPRQYWMPCQADQWIHQINIRMVSA